MPRQHYFTAIKPLFSAVPMHKTADEYLAAICQYSKPIVSLFSAYCCDAEIRNGGLLQLFYNPTGICVPEAILGFKAMGMPRCAEIVDSAARRLGDIYPRAYEDRQESLLRSTGKSLDEVAEIASRTVHPFQGFAEVTREVNFDDLTDEYYKFAKSESGGFEQAAERYFETF